MSVTVSGARTCAEGAGGRHLFGAGFVDAGSGLRFEAHHPSESPELWLAYLDGASARYRYHAVEAALDRSKIEDGGATSLFWLARDGGLAVAGLRCKGPLSSSGNAHVLEELAAHPELDKVRASIDERIPFGVVEVKGVWVACGRHDKRALGDALARCMVHSMEWFDTRFALYTAAIHALPRWESSGARVAEGLATVAYPDDRYLTVLMWWDRDLIADLAAPAQLTRMMAEAAELRAASKRLRSLRSRSHGSFTPAVLSSGTLAPRNTWTHVVLDESNPAESRMVEELRSDPAIVVIDTLDEQREELHRLRPLPDDELEWETPRWIYYPWRSCLTHMLGPLSFRRLRLDRNRNKITLDEQARVSKLRIGVVGLSVGHVIAHTLALEGLCGELRLADFDRIELSNLNRIPVSILDIGTNKAVVAARRIAELDPYLKLSLFEQGVSAGMLDEFLDGLDLVIEECDSLDVKLLIREAARRHGIPVIMETSDRGMLDVERYDLTPDRPLFHGLVDDLRASEVAGLTTHDKVPFVLRILEPGELSSRMAASMAEIDDTVTTWPQLGGDVTLGAATVAAAVRRLGRGEDLPSGRLRIDLDDMIDRLVTPETTSLVLDVPVTPRPEPADDLLRVIAHAASLAPSGGNSQPWRFEGDEEHLEVHLVRERTSTVDVAFRGSYVAIGAALLNARIAASSRARLGSVELFPHGGGDDHVATLHFGQEIDLSLVELHSHMLARATNRREGIPAPVDTWTVELMRHAVEQEGGRLNFLDSRAAIEECAELLGESHRLRFLSPRLHRDLMSELRWPGHDSIERGIDVRTLELDQSDLAKLAVAGRVDVMKHLASWRAGRALGDTSRDRVRSSSGIAVVTVPGSDPESYVLGGAAAERMWLCAQRAGLAIQPVSPVFLFARDRSERERLVPRAFLTDLEEIADRFSSLVGLPDGESLVLVLRVSHADAPSGRSRRLPLEEVLTVMASSGD
jgi:ThiF family